MVSESVHTLGYGAFSGADMDVFRITENVRVIGPSAYSGLTVRNGKIVIPDSVEIIGERAFYNCKSLKEVIMNEVSEICRIEEACFSFCTSLTNIEYT